MIGTEFIALSSVAAGLTVVMAAVYKFVSPVVPFLYANAKIMARSNYLLDDSKQRNLMQAKSLRDLGTRVQSSLLMPGIEGKTTLREFHSALEKSFIASVKELREMSPNKIHKMFDSYLLFWEAKMLKTFYRALFFEQKEQLDSTLVFGVGSIDSMMRQRLREAKSIADLGQVMSNTVFAEAFKKQHETIEGAETAIDNCVFKNFVKNIKKSKLHDGKYIIEAINIRFDILNLLMLLKAKNRKTEAGKIKELLIKNDSPLFKRFDELIKAESLDKLVELCADLIYGKVLEQSLAAHKKDQQLSHFEIGLWRFYKKLIQRQDSIRLQGPFPVFSYLTKKEFELRNLVVISTGVNAGYTQQQMEELIV